MVGYRQIAFLMCVPLVLSTLDVQAQVSLKPVLHRLVSVDPGEAADLQAQFFMPQAVVTGADGRIYVADAADLRVKVFDKDGGFIHAFGSEGQGPGEFFDFRSLSMDHEGNLLVVEDRNSRITRITPDGTVLETMRVTRQSGALANAVTPLGDGDFLTLFAPSIRDKTTPILHVFSNDFSTEKASFGLFGDYGDSGEPFWFSSYSGNPGSFWTESGQRLIYAPYLYVGELFMYELQEGTWKLIKVLEGLTERKTAFKRVEPEFFRSGDLSDGLIGSTNHSRRGVYSAIIYNQSQKVFELRDGRIIHFSLQLLDDGYRLFLEVFDKDGTLVGFGPITRLMGGEDVELHKRCRVVWKDDQDRFYLLEQSENPRIHVVSLSY